jgi:hypothetical protein
MEVAEPGRIGSDVINHQRASGGINPAAAEIVPSVRALTRMAYMRMAYV